MNRDSRPDDAAERREVPCPYCGGAGEVATVVTSTLDPNGQREFRQRCIMCGGYGKVEAE